MSLRRYNSDDDSDLEVVGVRRAVWFDCVCVVYRCVCWSAAEVDHTSG